MHPRTDHLIDLALEEDAGLGDVTSRAIFPAGHTSRAFISAGHDLVVCGLDVAVRVFEKTDRALKARLLARDGDRIRKGARVLSVHGPTEALLTAERTALNFMQRLSGIATLSRRFADAVDAGSGITRRRDTRKTTPGFRALEEIRRPLRGMPQPPQLAGRARPHQGQPHRRRGIAPFGRGEGPVGGAPSCADRGRGQDPRAGARGDPARRPRSSFSTTCPST